MSSKGYLIDKEGHIVDKRGRKVFDKKILEKDGDVPKVFSTGLLRKDTFDTFAQLMSEIEELEN